MTISLVDGDTYDATAIQNLIDNATGDAAPSALTVAFTGDITGATGLNETITLDGGVTGAAGAGAGTGFSATFQVGIPGYKGGQPGLTAEFLIWQL
ncbi:hypothetical protein [Desulforamulus ferrireducens]|uniref:Uncharacterized protein n=1 Tax=Desulforamulus ferrireducens TaxID=1833852 RepID=A0A1S6IYJ8_9FIRM|nr:hypothetical protein [Desulforamulus ferrireducens]AQS59845.1 hypothetical protein B0537_12580 [Desulforamulus ferrireducens]